MAKLRRDTRDWLAQSRSVPLSEHEPARHDKPKPTAVGCVLMLLSVAVIFGTAIPIVRWRDAETGEPLPRMVVIVAPSCSVPHSTGSVPESCGWLGCGFGQRRGRTNL